MLKNSPFLLIPFFISLFLDLYLFQVGSSVRPVFYETMFLILLPNYYLLIVNFILINFHKFILLFFNLNIFAFSGMPNFILLLMLIWVVFIVWKAKNRIIFLTVGIISLTIDKIGVNDRALTSALFSTYYSYSNSQSYPIDNVVF